MSDLDSELAELAAELPVPRTKRDRLRDPITLREVARLVREERLSMRGACQRLNLSYATAHKLVQREAMVWEAFKGVPPEDAIEFDSPMASWPEAQDPQTIENLRNWAKNGVSHKAMSVLLRMTENQFENWIKKSPRFGEAVRMGEAEGEAEACAAQAALIQDRTHKAHERAVMARLDRLGWKTGNPEDKKALDAREPLTPEQITEALRAPSLR